MKQTPLNLGSLGVHVGVLATPLLGVPAGEPGTQLMAVRYAPGNLQGAAGYVGSRCDGAMITGPLEERRVPATPWPQLVPEA